MKLTSPAFEHNGKIPSKYTCDGKNISPPLNIENIPNRTKSLALIMEDPDVPKNIRSDGMWDHWIAWNISPETKILGEGKKVGIQGINTSKGLGYTGPCPPDREHRYFFKLFALDSDLNLKEGFTKKDLLEAMKGHVIEQAELIGRYNRS